MRQIKLLILFLLLLTMSFCAKNKRSDLLVKEQLLPVDLSDVKVGGEIGRRIDVTITNNLLKLDVDNDFLTPFHNKTGNYIGLGKTIDAVVKMAVYSGDEKVISLKKHLVEEIIKTQEADGYIGNKNPKGRMWSLWDIHEMGYIIYGLTNDYKYFKNKESLASARKVADYILKNWSSIPSDIETRLEDALHMITTGLHRTMLTLYTTTSDRRYLDFCLMQLNLKNWDPGILIGRGSLNIGHVYSYLAVCLAQLELYRLQPEDKLLLPTMKAMNFITSKNGMTITGGVGQMECWTDDQDGRGDLGETCATAYLIRIYDNLLRLKGDSRFGDIMERTIYNALFGAQSPNGRQIRYYTPFEGRRIFWSGDTYCCPNNYRRIISELPALVYYRDGEGVVINLYSQSEAKIAVKGRISVTVRQKTDYPNSGNVEISVDPSESAEFPLKLRIPGWCGNAKLIVNGDPSETICIPGTFAVIKRTWKAGDKVVLNMPMSWRLIQGRQRQAGRVAVMRGPLLFCLNPEQNESLIQKDAADIGRILIDLEYIEQETVLSNAVHPDGIGCSLKCREGETWIMSRGLQHYLTLTEFADPDGKCTYFRIPDLSKAVPDELSNVWE